ncbi:MAG: hypothetical protein A3J83_01420 [Elusimicrobia bacterium RIFOXYA2_FULL_40_6]|nr:MAG: hypothetical protein A3J83_01420 [Elusimicrobia bacterium RIFOXYA2_FULL_40_6]
MTNPKSDIKILSVKYAYTDEKFRVPLKFGVGYLTNVPSSTVIIEAINGTGKKAKGIGNILLSDLWAFPGSEITHDEKINAFKEITKRFAQFLQNSGTFGHPIDLYLDSKHELLKIASSVEKEMKFNIHIPVLASLMVGSPFDAALHDAFGRINGICSYDGYGKEFISKDLSNYLGPKFKGKYISDYLNKEYKPSLPIFHLVGGLDKLYTNEIEDSDPKDGLPVSLEQWIEKDGIFCFKIKLTGKDIKWDVDRTVNITDLIASGGLKEFYLTCDSNEQSPDPEAVIEYLLKVKERSELAFEKLLYYEQPTERDIEVHKYDMHAVSKIKPVLVDEGITSLEKVDLAHELGWTGLALKTCKGHSSALLSFIKASELKMPCSVQDLTNPGVSFIHSAGFAARIDTIMGVEYNARQYIPSAQKDIQEKHKSLFEVVKGKVSTVTVGNTGLGY